MKIIDRAALEANFKELINILKIDSNTEDLQDTPARCAKMYAELLSGYEQSPQDFLKTFSNNGYSGLVTVSDIFFHSLCEHHMIPFFGKMHIGYYPNKKILGLSKFGRIVDLYAKRLQIQERLTQQVGELITSLLQPHGVIVVCEAEHMCMSMRGVTKPGSYTRTIYKEGIFSEDRNSSNEFINALRSSK